MLESILSFLFLFLNIFEDHGEIVHYILFACLLNSENLSALIKESARETNVD
jgi:hypothetical protein